MSILDGPYVMADRLNSQREADRAPPLLVLSLPERIWTPDIIWEKEESDSDSNASTPTSPSPKRKTAQSDTLLIPPPPTISPSEITTPPLTSIPEASASTSAAISEVVRGKKRTKSGVSKKYFSKDECAICMDNFQKGEVVRILPCGHVFHKDECDEWLLKWRKLVRSASTFCFRWLSLRSSAPLAEQM
jgi:hypothetical protein